MESFFLNRYPKAILHIDGDSFFASCEIAQRPNLKGLPVVTGRERGIASSMSYEAKALGVTRGMSVYEIKKICPNVVILPSDYETYSLYSKRMYEIVRRYTPEVEEYSIDECFADITGTRRIHHASYQKIAEKIKNELQNELGITFSVGLSATKVLAKIGSKWQKPDGLVFIPLKDAPAFLRKTNVGKIWGIGPQTSALLNKKKIYTAYDLATAKEEYIKTFLSKPFTEIWRELRGEAVYSVKAGEKNIYKSISKTRTFTPESNDRKRVFAELSKNIENACIKARRHHLSSDRVFLFLKSNAFKYCALEIKLSIPTNTPSGIVVEADKVFNKIFNENTKYRATGVVLSNLRESKIHQASLFGESVQRENDTKIYEVVDKISAKYGKHSLFLGSSYEAMVAPSHRGRRGEGAKRKDIIFKGETKRKRVNFPYLGEVV